MEQFKVTAGTGKQPPTSEVQGSALILYHFLLKAAAALLQSGMWGCELSVFVEGANSYR